MSKTVVAPSPSGAEPAPVNPWLRRALIVNLAVEVLIVVTGGTVRLTKSGLGCPTWPRCTPESMVPVADQAEGFHKIIEFGNRMLTSVVSIAALLVIIAIWRLAPHRKDLRKLSVLPLIGVGLQAVLGGITVLYRLNPAVVALHFLASMVLVTLSAYLLHRVGEGDVQPQWLVRPEVRWMARAATALLAVVLVLGTIVTGTGPHSGDRNVHRFPFDPRTVSWLHADSVMLLLGLLAAIWLAVRLSPDAHSARRPWAIALGVALGQGLIGYVQYFTKLPEALVLAHMFGATMLVVAVTFAVLSLRTRAATTVSPDAETASR